MGLYIIKESLLGSVKDTLLKLDREGKKLEFYRRVPNERLHDHYTIREDFDSSDYAMFEVEKSFDCIYGGTESPTPDGIFTVLKKTPEEYISGYYPTRGAVKFFGYLVIFEDYFIHSDLYEEAVTEDAMRNGSAEPISSGDDHTSGCIRVSQENLDWLVENVAVGTIVVW